MSADAQDGASRAGNALPEARGADLEAKAVRLLRAALARYGLTDRDRRPQAGRES